LLISYNVLTGKEGAFQKLKRGAESILVEEPIGFTNF